MSPVKKEMNYPVSITAVTASLETEAVRATNRFSKPTVALGKGAVAL
jgi:hypothetical protein